MRRVPALLAVVVLAASCSGGGEDSASTTTASTTTLPAAATTTSIPSRAALEVDVCGLLREEELATVLDDPGVGEPTVTTPPPLEGRPPQLLTGECAWPSVAEAAFTLYYLAPTTAPDGPSHLRDVLALETGFAEGGTVTEQTIRGQLVGFLLDAEGRLREVAVKKRSALVYLVLDTDVDGRDADAVTAHGDLVVTALIRAPR